MKRMAHSMLAAVIAGVGWTAATAQVPSAPNGIAFPAGYQDWRVISVSHRQIKVFKLQPADTSVIKLHEFPVDFDALVVVQNQFGIPSRH